MCTLEIPQTCSTSSLLLTFVTFTFEPFLKVSFPQTMSFSCIFVIAPSFIRMESGDSSDEEAPPTNPNRKQLMRKEWMVAVSMLVTMKTDERPRRGAIMFVTKKFRMAHCSVYHLWERVKSACELGAINSQKFISQKKELRRRVMYPTEFVWESIVGGVVGGWLFPPHEVLRHFNLFYIHCK